VDPSQTLHPCVSAHVWASMIVVDSGPEPLERAATQDEIWNPGMPNESALVYGLGPASPRPASRPRPASSAPASIAGSMQRPRGSHTPPPWARQSTSARHSKSHPRPLTQWLPLAQSSSTSQGVSEGSPEHAAAKTPRAHAVRIHNGGTRGSVAAMVNYSTHRARSSLVRPGPIESRAAQPTLTRYS
jgi:hypothetical protein